MDKNAIKKYAIWARRELIERVAQRAAMYGITEKDHGDPEAESVDGRLLSPVEKRQRQALIRNIADKGYQQVIEEVAYTWFNRFAALRFMEVNGYLPTHIRVFTNDANEFKPQILTEAIHLDLEGLNKNKVYELENENKTEELFKYLLIVQCNALNEILPGMFQKIDDYTELLLPDNLLRQGSVIEQMITMIPEEDWTDQVQIIGWLYQYYNTEPKDKVFADLKKNIKITKENIPAATQLFTPDWIVHYMVENSLGRLWLEGHPNEALKSEWKYYLDEAEQEPEVQVQLDAIRKEYAALKPEEIKVIDPCMGSGHILCVLFDVLVQIYEDYGHSAREAAATIVENNLWGLDIDDRAAQLAYFAVMMKARQYDRRFFSRKLQPHVYAIEESNGITTEDIQTLSIDFPQTEREEALKQLTRLLDEMHNAKEYGSIINVTPCDWSLLRRFVNQEGDREFKQLDIYKKADFSIHLQHLINVSETLGQKYHSIDTNPPYMGDSGMSPHLLEFVKSNYPDTKTDMSTVFMEKTINMCKDQGFVSMINIPVWMSISSYERYRKVLLQNNEIVNMLHFGRGIFGADFGSTSFTIQKTFVQNFAGTYLRLFTKPSLVDSVETKEKWFFERKGKHIYKQDLSFRIPGQPIAYWFSEKFVNSFHFPPLNSIAEPKVGLQTGENNRFIRLWYECYQHKVCYDTDSIGSSINSGKKWFPYNKGGEYRKWYGNNDYVVNWENDGYEIRHFVGEKGKLRSRPQNTNFYFQESITWSKVTIGNIAFRYKPTGHIFDVAGTSIFADHQRLLYLLGFCNSKTALEIATLFSPSMNYEVGHIAKFPVIIDESKVAEVEELVETNIHLSKSDWDSFETSWDFNEHPMVYFSHGVWDVTATMCTIHHFFGRDITINTPIEASWWLWKAACEDRFQKLKANEKELNRIFIDIYGLQDELTPEVVDKDVTVRKADLGRDIRSFISYAVGCMFGRYSLDHEGLIFAGGDFDDMFSKRKEYLAEAYYNPDEPPAEEYICLKTNDGWKKKLIFLPDKDNILPICDDEYFEDDIVDRFVTFVEIVYGKEKLEENLRFIADALGGKGAVRDVIRSYFLNDFYADHLKVYQKRPIYWLFDSGKKNGFKCLIYMHRYQPDTIARIRTDYIHEQQSRYRTAIADLEQRINSASTVERVKLNKQLTKLQDQAAELKEYEEKIHHLADQMIKIDLDDGVKVNYAKFQDVLAPIK